MSDEDIKQEILRWPEFIWVDSGLGVFIKHASLKQLIYYAAVGLGPLADQLVENVDEYAE